MLRPNVGTFVVKRASVLFRTALLSSIAGKTSLALTLTWGLPATAWAAGNSPAKEYPPCSEAADDTNVQAARGAFEAGKAAFHESDFPRAILYWEDAFRRDCTAVLMLKNLTRAYEANGQYTEAAVALQTYLTRAPDAEDKPELEAQLRAIQTKVRNAGSPPGAANRPAKPQGSADPVARKVSASPRPAASSLDQDGNISSESATESGSPKGTKIAAGIVAGAGAALTLASAVFWFDANSDEKAAETQCPERKCDDADAIQRGNDAIDRKQRWAIIGGAGAALMTGGIVWYLLIPDDAEDVGLIPDVSPTYAGVTWSTEF